MYSLFFTLSIIIWRFIHVDTPSFLLLSSIPLYGYNTISLLSSFDGLKGYFQFVAIINKVTEHSVTSLCMNLCFHFFCKYIKVECLVHVFKKFPRCSLKWLYHYMFPPAPVAPHPH